jgi:uncharacterized protein YjbI with pentapeptide repeats
MTLDANLRETWFFSTAPSMNPSHPVIRKYIENLNAGDPRVVHLHPTPESHLKRESSIENLELLSSEFRFRGLGPVESMQQAARELKRAELQRELASITETLKLAHPRNWLAQAEIEVAEDIRAQRIVWSARKAIVGSLGVGFILSALVALATALFISLGIDTAPIPIFIGLSVVALAVWTAFMTKKYVASNRLRNQIPSRAILDQSLIALQFGGLFEELNPEIERITRELEDLGPAIFEISNETGTKSAMQEAIQELHEVYAEAESLAQEQQESTNSSVEEYPPWIMREDVLRKDELWGSLGAALIAGALGIAQMGIPFALLNATSCSYAAAAERFARCADLTGIQAEDLDLSGATLANRNLSDVRLPGANLTNANLSKVDLSFATLTSANLSNADLSEAEMTQADLTGATLTSADLTQARLNGSDLSQSNAAGATLTKASLDSSNLEEANLSGADLNGASLLDSNLVDANLVGANLSDADLSGANLAGVNLTRAVLKNTDFRRANLADTDLKSLELEGVQFDGANLAGLKLNEVDFRGLSFKGASFAGANLAGANFTNADLTDVDFTDANLTDAILKGADLSGIPIDVLLNAGANLEGAQLGRASFSGLSGTEPDLSGLSLSEVDLSNLDLRKANLADASLSRADFSNSDLTGANFANANLSDSQFVVVDISGATFENANLTRVNFKDARAIESNFRNATMTGATLIGADFAGADFTGARGIGETARRAQWRGATCPDGQRQEICR